MPSVILVVASLKDRFARLLAKAPCNGVTDEELFCQETETVGEAEPFLQTLALNEIVNPSTGTPLLFLRIQVAFPLVALPEPKKDMFSFPYQPPSLLVVWLVPLQAFPLGPLPSTAQLLGVLVPKKPLKFSVTAVEFKIDTCAKENFAANVNKMTATVINSKRSFDCIKSSLLYRKKFVYAFQGWRKQEVFGGMQEINSKGQRPGF